MVSKKQFADLLTPTPQTRINGNERFIYADDLFKFLDKVSKQLDIPCEGLELYSERKATIPTDKPNKS